MELNLTGLLRWLIYQRYGSLFTEQCNYFCYRSHFISIFLPFRKPIAQQHIPCLINAFLSKAFWFSDFWIYKFIFWITNNIIYFCSFFRFFKNLFHHSSSINIRIYIYIYIFFFFQEYFLSSFMPVPFHTLRKAYLTIRPLLKRLNPLCLFKRFLYHPSLLYHSILWRGQLGRFPCNMLSALIHSSLRGLIDFIYLWENLFYHPFHAVEGIDFLASFHNTILPSFVGMALPISLQHTIVPFFIPESGYCIFKIASIILHCSVIPCHYGHDILPSFTSLGRGSFSYIFSKIFCRF